MNTSRRSAFAAQPGPPYPIGLAALLATVTMLFAAFTAAVFMRRGMGSDWAPVRLPSLAWANTLVLALSSVAVEAARRGAPSAMARRLGVAGLLGLAFLAGQVGVWVLLARQGVFLPTSPHAAFFYILSGVHGAHVLGGLGALAWTGRRAARGVYRPGNMDGLTHTAIYWHFVGAVWIYLLVLLTFSERSGM